jgi:hypothetical protein
MYLARTCSLRPGILSMLYSLRHVWKVCVIDSREGKARHLHFDTLDRASGRGLMILRRFDGGVL